MNRQIYDNYVTQVVKHGSLTNAAKALKISQPALSQGLNALEKEIGLKIFNRRANPITLTPEGELYYKHICRMEVLYADFEKELSGFRNKANNKVVIGAPAVYVNAIIAPAVVKLVNSHPEYEVSIKTEVIENLIALSAAGKLDCFISTIEDLPDTFQKKLIYQEEIVLCVPQDCELFNNGIDAQELEKQKFIFLEEEFPLQQSVNLFLEEKGIRPAHNIIVDQVSAAVNLVEQGLGVCFASKEAAESRNVKTFPVGIVGRNIYLAFDKELYQTKACASLIDMVTVV